MKDCRKITELSDIRMNGWIVKRMTRETNRRQRSTITIDLLLRFQQSLGTKLHRQQLWSVGIEANHDFDFGSILEFTPPFKTSQKERMKIKRWQIKSLQKSMESKVRFRSGVSREREALLMTRGWQQHRSTADTAVSRPGTPNDD